MRSPSPAAVALMLVSAAAAGCSDATTILAEVRAGPQVDTASLSLTIRSGATASVVTRPLPAASRESVLIQTPDEAWDVELDLSARSLGGAMLAASTTVRTIPHAQVDAQLAIDVAGGDGGGGDGAGDGSSPCGDGVKDGSESDVDCGGACAACPVGRRCSASGDCQTGFCDANRVCSPVSDPPRWIPVAPLPTARAGLAVAGSDGGVYALGGYTLDGGTALPLSAAEVYAPEGDQWQPLPQPMPTARLGLAAAVTSSGELIAAGGWPDGTFQNALGVVESFSPASRTWTTLPDLPTARAGLAAAATPDGTLYTVGGETALDWADAVEALSPLHDWSKLPSLPVGRGDLALALGADGLLHAIGGQTAATFQSSTLAAPPGGAWAASAPLPDYRSAAAAAAGGDGRIYLIGGNAPGPAAVLAYQPASDGWLPVADLATAREQLGAAVGPDGRIYAVGGLDGAGAVSAAVEAYGPVIALSAGAGAAGSHVQVTGDNFAPSAQVDVFFAGAPAALGTGSTDPSGVLTAPIDLTVPSLPPATYPVRVVDRRSLFPVLARFTIQ